MFRDFLRSYHDEGLKSYFEDIGNRFCPFLLPSIKLDALYFSEYEFNDVEFGYQEQLFYVGVIHSEILRIIRRNEVIPKKKLLLSENIIVNLVGSTNVSGKELFNWPHWMLKSLYSNTGILFGKFWIGEEDRSEKSGLAIPPPIRNILTIRTALMPTDERFFSLSAGLLKECNVEKDLGQNVFNALELSQNDVKVIAMFLQKIQTSLWSLSLVQELKSMLCQVCLFDKTKEWSKQFLTA